MTLEKHLALIILAGYLGITVAYAGHDVTSWQFWVFCAPAAFLIGRGIGA